MYRGGEGFTPYERRLETEFLEYETAILGLYRQVARRATLKKASHDFTHVDEDSSLLIAERRFDPITTPSPVGSRQKRRVFLRDVTTIVQQRVGSETTTSTEWHCELRVRAGRRSQVDTRPTLMSWQYTGADGVYKEPDDTDDWVFSNAGELREIITDDVRYREELDRQADVIRELQRLHALLTTGPQMLPVQA